MVMEWQRNLTEADTKASGKTAAMGMESTRTRQDFDTKGYGNVDSNIHMGYSSILMGICTKESGKTASRMAMDY